MKFRILILVFSLGGSAVSAQTLQQIQELVCVDRGELHLCSYITDLEGQGAVNTQVGLLHDRLGWVQGLSQIADVLQNVWNARGRYSVLFTDRVYDYSNGASGFFREDIRGPNEEPLVLVRARTLHEADAERGRRLVLHELTHAVHQREQPRALHWIQEGLALLTELKLGRSEPTLAVAFVDDSRVNLASGESLGVGAGRTEGPSGLASQTWRAQYGGLALFFYYLDRVCFGGSLIQSWRSAGLAANWQGWEEFLREHSNQRLSCGNARAVWQQFIEALYSPDLADPERWVFPGVQIPRTFVRPDLVARRVARRQSPMSRRGARHLPERVLERDAGFWVIAWKKGAGQGCAPGELEASATAESPQGRCLAFGWDSGPN
jgi:hypothetical protein